MTKYEYKIASRRGDIPKKNMAFLNEQSDEGWELTNIIPVKKLAMNGEIIDDLQFYFKKETKKKVING